MPVAVSDCVPGGRQQPFALPRTAAVSPGFFLLDCANSLIDLELERGNTVGGGKARWPVCSNLHDSAMFSRLDASRLSCDPHSH